MIVGIDEVGRGCLAGPLVAGAVLLREPIPGLRDSKQLSRAQRQALDVQIRAKAWGFGLGWVAADELDAVGLTQAVRLAMIRALEQITAAYEHIIIDGSYNFLAHLPNVNCIIKADDSVPAVSAASILAKVARDAYMAEAALRHPHYGFERHVGYATPMHRQALQQHGPCVLHRRSFAPVRTLVGK